VYYNHGNFLLSQNSGEFDLVAGLPLECGGVFTQSVLRSDEVDACVLGWDSRFSWNSEWLLETQDQYTYTKKYMEVL